MRRKHMSYHLFLFGGCGGVILTCTPCEKGEIGVRYTISTLIGYGQCDEGQIAFHGQTPPFFGAGHPLSVSNPRSVAHSAGINPSMLRR
ncbi:hypothetical protein BD324DRAFT_449755 [Kockovaella imperatae]|uniref:Secreted protein n=1 Tax=Kockovaella imperatae TaxID=4999 RepID=A0A1Y1UHA3_9TREE|nr:hypothetical protein BD324DRAFT_449755 [Kockovaella imperatae]ORX37431.1 hypothetical protein BD324DRAFT_449755 [Kockovaella imperatae]